MTAKTFYAEYRGPFLPDGPWEGSVQSIYSKAINLLHPSGILISIVNSIDQMTDYGIVVADFSSLLSGVSKGCRYSFKGDHVVFPDRIIDISGASVWTGIPDQVFSGISGDIMRIKHSFIEFAMEEGLSPLITKKKGNLYSDAAGKLIKDAVKTANIPGGLLLDLSSLVGMGPGFTPSGDDFLAGVMLYEAISGANLINRESIRAKLSRTTPGGKTLLLLALENSFPFYLKRFSESISTSPSSSGKAVKRAVKHGSTSGSDSLAGFILAVEKFAIID